MHMRRFRPEDAAAVASLFHDTVRRINCRDYTDIQVRAWAPDAADPAVWIGKLAGRFSIVAEQDGVITGFGDIEADGHLDHLFVHADHQGEGIGRRLAETMEAEARRLGLGRIFTEASITARPFFERLGYRVIQEQTVLSRGVEFINFRMEKLLDCACGQAGEHA